MKRESTCPYPHFGYGVSARTSIRQLQTMTHSSVSGGRSARLRSSAVAPLAIACLLGAAAPLVSAVTVDFSDLPLAGPSVQAGYGGVYHNGSDGAGGFTSGGAFFVNNYNSAWDSWDGFAYSTTNDTTNGYPNQYSAYSTGNDGAYAVAFPGYDTPATISFANGVAPVSVSLTNTTYAALDMLNGGLFGSKKFGGASGDDPDYFSITFTGYDQAHVETGAVTFFLADFRFESNSLDYIVNDWTTLDLSGLGLGVRGIELSWDSSDVGAFGINTPLYVALDDLVLTVAIPEPASAAALAGLGALGLVVAARRRRAPRA